METPFFTPYIGDGFKRPQNNIFGGLKILVVGHNHYCNCLLKHRSVNAHARCGKECTSYAAECHLLTNQVVRNFLDYCKGHGEFSSYMNTFTKFANAISNYQHSAAQVWNDIAFYNFCQAAVSFDEDIPTREVYEISKEPFLKIVEKTMPDIIICWSRDYVYMNTPSTNWTSPQNEESGYYTIHGVRIPMIHMHHPSWQRFIPESEYSEFSNNINKALKTKNISTSER